MADAFRLRWKLDRPYLEQGKPEDVYVLPQLGWTPDSGSVAFQQMNRAQDELELRLVPVPSSAAAPLGTPRTVLTERSKTWLNTFGAPRFLKDGRRFLWLSERDGFAHIYLCSLDGAPPLQLGDDGEISRQLQ